MPGHLRMSPLAALAVVLGLLAGPAGTAHAQPKRGGRIDAARHSTI
jgi:hypothetical protein